MSFKVEKEITPQQLAARLKQNEEIVIIDVREPTEWGLDSEIRSCSQT